MFATALISATTTLAANLTDDKQEVPLKEVHDISDGYIPHRAPSRNLCPVMLILNETEGTIEFTADTDVYNISVNLYDEEENTICTSVIDIYANETTSVSILDLDEGDYRVEVIVHGVCYKGYITITY